MAHTANLRKVGSSSGERGFMTMLYLRSLSSPWQMCKQDVHYSPQYGDTLHINEKCGSLAIQRLQHSSKKYNTWQSVCHSYSNNF